MERKRIGVLRTSLSSDLNAFFFFSRFFPSSSFIEQMLSNKKTSRRKRKAKRKKKQQKFRLLCVTCVCVFCSASTIVGCVACSFCFVFSTLRIGNQAMLKMTCTNKTWTNELTRGWTESNIYRIECDATAKRMAEVSVCFEWWGRMNEKSFG